ncbi:MAG: hypothetical protein C4294_08050 [Nitrospiraceae bacterium]
MSTATSQTGIGSLHDYIVSLVAQRWAKSMGCRVTINTASEENRWTGGNRRYPDIVGWQFNPSRNTVEWIAEVETEESFSELDAHGRWLDYTELGLPFYLFVPKGYRETAELFARRASVKINRVYEYAFVNDAFQLS